MKYIATENGIYDLENSVYHLFSCLKLKVSRCLDFEESPNKCKVFNSIEEFCEEFEVVSVLTNVEPRRFKKFKDAKEYAIASEEVYGIVRGIRLVKMNAKGELEFI